MYDVAIIASTIPDRIAQFDYSLQTWRDSILDSGLKAVVCLWCDTDKRSVKDQYETLLRGHLGDAIDWYCSWNGQRNGTHAIGHNRLVESTFAKVYVFTHPEIMQPLSTIRTAYDNALQYDYVAFKVFWLNQRMTECLCQYPWQQPEQLEPHILQEYAGEHEHFYANSNIRSIERWRSTTTHAMSYENTKKLFPIPEFTIYGPGDPWHAGARDRLGFSWKTIMEPILVHQWHSRPPQDPTVMKGTGVRLALEELNRRFG